MAKRDEVPPWHAYCGCNGCRAAANIVRRFITFAPPPVESDDKR
jgi:hypothetical protein